MCARRFLMLVFILVLLVVGGAFAIYQFGGDILSRMATPVGHYQEPPKSDAPDYSKDANWIAKPGLPDNPSQWQPKSAGHVALDMERTATFYVHPTTYLERDRWNAPLNPTGETAVRARLFVQSQASAFTQFSDVWAPRYRQAAFGAFLLHSDDATKALDLAYGDVRNAFDAFLAAQPAGKPIILAGHSQGSLHILRLLADRRDVLKGRLVAAYVVGWPVSVRADLPATGLPPCTKREEAGCVLSWQSFTEPANPDLILKAWEGTRSASGLPRKRADMLCTNPLTGSRDGSSPPTAFAYPLVPDKNFSNGDVEERAIGARCDQGFLIVSGDLPNLGPYVLPGNNYHVYDYALFWGAIKDDAIERSVTAWRWR